MTNIEFRVRVSDLKSAVKQLLVNRGEFAQTDVADLLVSEIAATFRAVGTSTEVPVEGISLGAARIPLAILERFVRAIGTYKHKEVRVTVTDGTVKIDTMVHTNPAITVGIIPNQGIDLPVDATLLETLGIGTILSEKQISEQGLTHRIKRATEVANRAVKTAAGVLAEVGVSEAQIQGLVDERIRETGQRLVAGVFDARRL